MDSRNQLGVHSPLGFAEQNDLKTDSQRTIMIEISAQQARDFILEVQGLRTKTPCKSVLEVARRIYNIQIDTISVVSRSHDLIAFNRYPHYKEGSIWDYQKEGRIFEYWSHAMCLMPMEAYPLTAWRKSHYHEEMWSSFRSWGIKNKEVVEQVYNKVKEEGVTNSASLGDKKSRPSTGWWDWKVEKRALEYLFYLGDLMVAYRRGFQKYYDLPERVIPAGIDAEPPSDEEAARLIVESTLGSLGLGTQQDVRTYHGSMPGKKLWGGKKERVEAFLDTLMHEGLLEEVRIIGQKERYFTLSLHAEKLRSSLESVGEDATVKILSPFDNILRERHFPRRHWDFDYVVECYVPPAKRVYGYFVLPILDQSNLAGRLDAKVHREKGMLEIKSLYIENDELKTSEGVERLKAGLQEFAVFHNCSSISIAKVNPRNMTRSVRALLES